jgi:hypothetical protein
VSLFQCGLPNFLSNSRVSANMIFLRQGGRHEPNCANLNVLAQRNDLFQLRVSSAPRIGTPVSAPYWIWGYSDCYNSCYWPKTRLNFLEVAEGNTPYFSRCNSGATRMQHGEPVPRGPKTFVKAMDCDFPPSQGREVTFVEPSGSLQGVKWHPLSKVPGRG